MSDFGGREDDATVDTQFHERDVKVLRALGVTEVPCDGRDLSLEPQFGSFLRSCREQYSKQDGLPHDPRRSHLDFTSRQGVGPLGVFAILSDDGKALLTDVLLNIDASYKPWELWHTGTNRKAYPKMPCVSLTTHFLKEYGRVRIPGGVVPLAVMGAMRDGTKEVLAVTSGYRESTDSWAEVFRGLKARGLAAPKLLIADGNAAIWGAARTVWPEAGEQRCWNHKMRNVLDRLPQREQSEAKELLRTVVYASTRAAALKARQAFGKRYGPWYPKAVTVLEDDWDRMVTFYDFPEAHWKHLRTTNVVESPFASVRLRTSAAKRFKRVDSATALIWKLLTVAEKRFRRLDAPNLLKDVFEERKFRDGKPVSAHQRKAAA